MNAKAVNKKALRLAREIRTLGDKPFSAQNVFKLRARQREFVELCMDALEAGMSFAEEKEEL